MNTLELKSIGYQIKEKRIFSNISFILQQGDKLVINGENGSGKSTLLKVLSSLLRPTEGSLIYNQLDLNKNLSTYREAMSYCTSSNLGFYPRLSGEDNLIYFSFLRGQYPNTKEIMEVLDRVGLTHESAQKNYSSYSQGMKQRLGIARSLLSQAQIYLLDEPTHGLDQKGLAIFRDILKNSLSSHTVILVTHDNVLKNELNYKSIHLGSVS